MNTQITPTFSTTKTAAVNTQVHAPLWIHMRISMAVKTHEWNFKIREEEYFSFALQNIYPSLQSH